MKLHETDAGILVEIWASIKPYVPAKEQKNCAFQFITLVDDAGLIDLELAVSELYGVCEQFDQALKSYCQDHDIGSDEFGYDDWEE